MRGIALCARDVLWNRSRAHKAPYHTWPDTVIARILDIRDHPPEGLRRVPGPRAYREHYNYQPPNQALSCGNRPPRVAFPALPARPSVPLLVDPDTWLETIDGRGYVR